MSEANQLKVISKKKNTDYYGSGNWGFFPFEETFQAYKDLSPAAFGLYLMLLKDAPNFSRDLYRVEYERLTGKKKTVYYAALKELKDKQYLKQLKGTTWEFYPVPDSGKTDSD